MLSPAERSQKLRAVVRVAREDASRTFEFRFGVTWAMPMWGDDVRK